MTVKIAGGRSMWAEAGTVKIREHNYGEDLFQIENVELQTHASSSEFILKSRHMNGTDVEHDAAYIAYFTGAGLSWVSLHGKVINFTGVLMTVEHYPQDFVIEDGASLSGINVSSYDDKILTCDDCVGDDAHLIMPFTPPRQKFAPALVDIEISFHQKKEKSND